MKILIMGGTGAMGKCLVELLSQQDVEVYITSRQKESPFPNTYKNISLIQGNAADLLFIRGLLNKKRFDVIVDFMCYSTEEFEERYNFFLSSTSQYVFLSSSRVYANTDVYITEKTPRLLDVCNNKEYLDTDEYALAKAREENILKNSTSINWTIVRPYITYSELRLQLGVLEKENWLYRALHGRTIVFSKDIAETYTTLTYGADVAAGILELLGNPKSYGEIFHITSEVPIKWGDVLDIYIKVIEQKVGFKPKVLILDAAPNLENVAAQYQVKYDRLFNRRFDNAKISQFIDVKSFRTPELALSKCLEEFLTCPKFGYINWRDEAKKDRQCNECASFSEFRGLKQIIKYLIFRYIYPNEKL